MQTEQILCGSGMTDTVHLIQTKNLEPGITSIEEMRRNHIN